MNCNLSVALRKESVDRNKYLDLLGWLRVLSLSARRAWIEILLTLCRFLPCRVALRKESVDRNYSTVSRVNTDNVALRKESVDRNLLFLWIMPKVI